MSNIQTLINDLEQIRSSDPELQAVQRQIEIILVGLSNETISPSEFIEVANNIKVEAVVLTDNAESVAKEKTINLLKTAMSLASLIPF